MTYTLRPTTQDSQPRTRTLFKADHPREIDRHIEFFGNRDATARDMCGEALLEALTKASEATERS